MKPDHGLLRTLILFSCLWLSGFDLSECSFGGTSGGDTDTGSSGFRVQVHDERKISANEGGFNGTLHSGDEFGSAVADIGDLESDGVRDIAVGAPFDAEGGNDDRGAVWILFMDDIGRVDIQTKITTDTGGFNGNLDNGDRFGSALAGIGDLNRDGTFDVASGAPGDDAGGSDRGAVWLLFLNAEGRVRVELKIADGDGGFNGNLHDDDRFGSAVAGIGDLNGDGVEDLAVGAPNDDDGAPDKGAVWILFMRSDGRVAGSQKISSEAGGFGSGLSSDDHFGSALAGLGDIDGDGHPDLAVGAPGDDEGGTDRGAVWIVFLTSEGRVRDRQKIAEDAGGFHGELNNGDRFGAAVAACGDLSGDGITELAVGAPNDDDGSSEAGAVWILSPRADGRVDAWQKISAQAGGFNGNLDADDHFGAALAGIGNLDNDGSDDLAVGAPGDDDGGTDQGALWILFLELRN